MGAEPDPLKSAGAGTDLVWTGDPLFALLDELRGEGFHIGVGEYLEAQAAAAACHRDGIGHDPRRLRNYLAPVLCTSLEQQQLFYRRFDAWWIDRAGGSQEELPPPPLPPPPLHESELGEVARRTRPWKWWAASALGVLAVLYLVGWPSLAGLRRSGPPKSAPPIKVPAKPAPAPPGQASKPKPDKKAPPKLEDAQAHAEIPKARILKASRTSFKIQVSDFAGRPVPQAAVRVELTKGKLVATLAGPTAKVNGASFSASGQRVATASDDGTAQIWDAETGKPLGKPLRHDQGISTAWFSPDDQRVITTSPLTQRIWNAATGKPLGEWRAGGALAVSPDGRRVVSTSFNIAKIREAESGKQVGKPMRNASIIDSAAFSPNGQRVLTASTDGTTQIWDATTGEPLGVPLQHGEGHLTASFSQDGKRILTASGDNTARIWDAATSRPLVMPMRHDGDVLTASFSPDGTRVVTAGADCTARIWDATTGRPLGRPLRHDDNVWAASFSANSKQVITASADGTVRIWDAKESTLIGELSGDEGNIIAALFIENSPKAITASTNGTVRIWTSYPQPTPRPTLGTTNEKGELSLNWAAADRPQILSLTHPGHHPPSPFQLPAGTLSGTLHVKLAPLTFWQGLLRHQRKIQAGLALLPLALAGPWLAWRVVRRRQLVLERRTTRGEQAVASPSLPEPQHDLYRDIGFARARVEAQRRQRVGAGDLDPDATVEATMRNLGFFTPVYRARLELPVYLVLIDRIGIRDQRARMVDELLDRLQAGGVALVRYDFDRDPRRASLRSSGGVHRDLQELAGLYPGHRLAVFTDGAGFTEPATGRLAAWSELFSAWPERALLTPVPLDHWSRRELDLAAAGFAILPASEAGIERLADMFRRTEGAVPRPLEETWSPPYPDLLASRPGRFLERHTPEESELSVLCGELAFYLGPDGYRWLCSLAVYPELDWYFTLYLGLLLRRFDGRKVLDEATLLALTRLPWLRHGSMPDWLRLRLLRDLSENDEKDVRDWMRLFLEQREIPGSRFRLDVALPPKPEPQGLRERLRHWIESKDWRRLIKDWAHHESQEGALRDQIFVSFLLGTKPSRLQVVAPSAWRRLVWEQGMPALGPRTGSVLLLTALLSVLGFVLGGPDLEWMARQSPPEQSTITADLDSFQVTINLSGESWIRAVVDGRPQYNQLFVARDESVSLEAQREVRLTIGNPSVLQVTVNGYPMKLDPTPGGVIRDLVIDADTVKSLAGVAQKTGG